MSSAKRLVSLAQLCTKQYCSSASVRKPSGRFPALKEKQSKFQCDDGLPVYLKGGFTDKILYQATFLLIFVGSGMMFKLFWDLAVPKKQ